MSSATASASGVTADVLFAGVTRPAVALGVPYAALLLNAFITLELFLVTRNLLCLPICLPIHGLSWLLCVAEPRFFELLAVRIHVRARGAAPGARRWRAASYSPLRPMPRTALAGVPPAIVESRGRSTCSRS
jgi:type IV secretion system protein VirB3